MKTGLILDTDVDTDCDDAGALAVLHALTDAGQAALLGVICSIPVEACARCVQAINAAYRRADLPVGLIRIDDWTSNTRYRNYRVHRETLYDHANRPAYNDVIGTAWAQTNPDAQVHEAVQLYRSLLASQPDGGVTICAIGTLTALDQLLDSAPDAISSLTGTELVARKVSCLVTMAVGSYPEGRDGFNWVMDLPAAARVIRDWPVPLIVSALGSSVLTGRRLMEHAPEDHPVGQAYCVYLGSKEADRPSWDLIAALYAATGAGQLLRAHLGYTLTMDPGTGSHSWHIRTSGPERGYLSAAVPDDVLAREIEDLMIRSLG